MSGRARVVDVPPAMQERYDLPARMTVAELEEVQAVAVIELVRRGRADLASDDALRSTLAWLEARAAELPAEPE